MSSTILEEAIDDSSSLDLLKPGTELNLRYIAKQVLESNYSIGVILFRSSAKPVVNNVIQLDIIDLKMYDPKQLKSSKKPPERDIWIIEEGVDHAISDNVGRVIKLPSARIKALFRTIARVHTQPKPDAIEPELRTATQNEIQAWMNMQVESLTGFSHEDAEQCLWEEIQQVYRIEKQHLFRNAFKKFWQEHGAAIRVGKPLVFIEEVISAMGECLNESFQDGLWMVHASLQEQAGLEESIKELNSQIGDLQQEVADLKAQAEKNSKRNQMVINNISKELTRLG